MDDLLWAYLLEHPRHKLEVRYSDGARQWVFTLLGAVPAIGEYRPTISTWMHESRTEAIRGLLQKAAYID